jgi:hypothetical protein
VMTFWIAAVDSFATTPHQGDDPNGTRHDTWATQGSGSTSEDSSQMHSGGTRRRRIPMARRNLVLRRPSMILSFLPAFVSQP